MNNFSPSLTKSAITASMNQIENSYQKRKQVNGHHSSNGRHLDERSIKSLDFESDTGQHNVPSYDDYASEPVPAPKIRPTPPKKPLRLSLQRAQSLQAVTEADNILDQLSSVDKKRGTKRIHKGELNDKFSSTTRLSNGYSRSIELSAKFIENSLSTSCRQKFV